MAVVGARKRKQPIWYGDIANLPVLIDTDEFHADPYSDCSIDDPIFEPKRQKLLSESMSDNSFKEENFDEEFNQNQIKLNVMGIQSNGSTNDSCNSPLDEMFLQKQLIILQRNSVEILTRLSVIEESLLRSGNLITSNSAITERDSFEKYHVFSKSNSLPMKSIAELSQFENKSKEIDFEKEAVSKFTLKYFYFLKHAKHFNSKPIHLSTD